MITGEERNYMYEMGYNFLEEGTHRIRVLEREEINNEKDTEIFKYLYQKGVIEKGLYSRYDFFIGFSFEAGELKAVFDDSLIGLVSVTIA